MKEETYKQLVDKLADNKYLLAEKLTQIGMLGPNLEASLACVALAQEEFGHVRVLKRYAVGERKDYTLDSYEACYSSLKDCRKWAQVVTFAHVLTQFTRFVLNVPVGNSDSTSRGFKKVLDEVDIHEMYTGSWVRSLLDLKTASQVVLEAQQQLTAEIVADLDNIDPGLGEQFKSSRGFVRQGAM